MKRSEINRALRELEDMCRRERCYLPPFCHFTPEDWKTLGHEYDEVRECMLGWDLVTQADVENITGSLTDRQKQVADALQHFMSTVTSGWGNYVSMIRFGVEQFTEENYFPINSDGRYLSETADESPDNAGLYALLNSSFTKELKENAKNRIILYNVFDVFANHTASMAQYRSF